MGKKMLPHQRKTLEENLRDIMADAKITFEVMQSNIIAQRLQNGIDCGVPDDHLSAIFDLSVEEVEHFRNTGELH